MMMSLTFHTIRNKKSQKEKAVHSWMERKQTLELRKHILRKKLFQDINFLFHQTAVLTARSMYFKYLRIKKRLILPLSLTYKNHNC